MLVFIHKTERPRVHSVSQSLLLWGLFHSPSWLGEPSLLLKRWKHCQIEIKKMRSVFPAGSALSPFCSIGAVLYLVSIAQFSFLVAAGCLLGSLIAVSAVLGFWHIMALLAAPWPIASHPKSMWKFGPLSLMISIKIDMHISHTAQYMDLISVGLSWLLNALYCFGLDSSCHPMHMGRCRYMLSADNSKGNCSNDWSHSHDYSVLFSDLESHAEWAHCSSSSITGLLVCGVWLSKPTCLVSLHWKEVSGYTNRNVATFLDNPYTFCPLYFLWI